ncbi:hypothetical protein ABKV19_017632 [Rosa sericea]
MAGFNKMGCILTAFLGFMFLQLCSATRYYDWVLTETNFTRLCSTKSILTVNGGFPGPPIQVHKGETIYVNIHNQGLYGVTIHWHGVKQPRNPWSDGPENITQCPIQAGSNFTYEVVFSSEEGTLWWHAHSDWTRATVHGAIVVLPAAGTTYPFATPYAQQTIILASTYRLLVDYGKTYMLRIINAIMNEEQFFAIANHNLTVVTQDASYIKPITTPYIMITPGQTMDVLVTTNQPRSHYYMASTAYIDGNVPYHNCTTTAILQYRGNYSTPSITPFPNLPIHNDTTAADNFTARVKSLASKAHPISVPTNITTRIYMTVSINERICANASCAGPDNNAIAASLNNISFKIPSIDILQAYYRGINGVFQGNFPSNPPLFYNFTGEVVNSTKYPTFGTKVKFLKYGEGVEIIFQGTNLVAPENHPMHLHGFSFYLVGTGYGNFNKTTSPKTYNLVDPPEANTIGVPKNGWATIRFVADNPGVWFMHCHLERHASWGMDTVFIVRNGNTKESKLRPPPAHMPPCSKS